MAMMKPITRTRRIVVLTLGGVFLIAAIGCLEGFKVSGSAESVGAHTTSSVVQSIFVVILLDAVAALFFMEMNW